MIGNFCCGIGVHEVAGQYGAVLSICSNRQKKCSYEYIV
jgi:hypothetical protein